MEDLRPHGIQVHHVGERRPQAAGGASGLLDPLCLLPVIPGGGGES
jgi:hypothetical protein